MNEKESDQFHELFQQRNSARQLAYNLSQELKFAGKFNPSYSIRENSERYDRLIKEMDLARGIGGYQFPIL